MKKFISNFCLRGVIGGGFGPIILAIVYFILKQEAVIDTIDVNEICLGIVSVYVLAFVAAGMNAIYQVEKLPLITAILIHGGVLYLCYLATYLVNNWFKDGITSILVFTGIFVVCYIIIWIMIYAVTKKKTDDLNAILKVKNAQIEKV